MKNARSIIHLLLLTLSAGCSYQALASGLPMERAELVSQSELIVIGKLSDRKELDATWATATLSIRETLKGDATVKKLTMKFLAKPGSTATWTYSGDEDGIWFLKKEGEGDKAIWSTFYAGGRIPVTSNSDEGKKEIAEALDEVKKLIAEQKKKDPAKESKTDK